MQTVDVRDGSEHEVYRVWGLRVRGPDGPTAVYVGASLELVSEATATLRGLLLVGVPVVAALLGLLTWVALGRMLAPVESITRQVAGISDAELDRRVPVPRTGDEIAELAGTMNAMLQRLEEARDRQQAFVADASHELQSPLTRLRTQLEVARATPTPDWDEVTTDLLADCGEMEALVRDLLFLARDDDGRPAGSPPSTSSSSTSTTSCWRRPRGCGRQPGSRCPPRRCPPRRCAAALTSCGDSRATCWRTRSPRRRAGSRCRCGPTGRARSWSSRTTVPGSRPTSGTGCSSGSSASTVHVTGRPGAAGWAWPSSARSPDGTVGARRSRTLPRGARLVVRLAGWSGAADDEPER